MTDLGEYALTVFRFEPSRSVRGVAYAALYVADGLEDSCLVRVMVLQRLARVARERHGDERVRVDPDAYVWRRVGPRDWKIYERRDAG